MHWCGCPTTCTVSKLTKKAAGQTSTHTFVVDDIFRKLPSACVAPDNDKVARVDKPVTARVPLIETPSELSVEMDFRISSLSVAPMLNADAWSSLTVNVMALLPVQMLALTVSIRRGITNQHATCNKQIFHSSMGRCVGPYDRVINVASVDVHCSERRCAGRC